MGAVRSNVVLKLGLITTSVSVQTAVSGDSEPQLNTVCRQGHPPGKVRQLLVCPQCNSSDKATFEKGQAQTDGSFVVVDPASLEAADATEEEKNSMALTAHPADQVDRQTLAGGKVYFLEDKVGSEAYPLLVELVYRNPEIALCTVWAPRSRPSMFRLGVFGDTLTITQLAWPAEVKEAPKSSGTLNEQMVPMAEQFLGQIKADFDPEQFTNRRAEILRQVVEGGEVTEPAEAPEPNTGLMDQLKQAVGE